MTRVAYKKGTKELSSLGIMPQSALLILVAAVLSWSRFGQVEAENKKTRTEYLSGVAILKEALPGGCLKSFIRTDASKVGGSAVGEESYRLLKASCLD